MNFLLHSVSQPGFRKTSSRVPREIAECREELQIALEISLQFLSGNWQYWIYLHTLTNSPFCFKSSLVGFPPDVKNHFRASLKKRVRTISLHSVGATGVENWQRFKRWRIANCLCYTFSPKRCTFCNWCALRNDERFQATALHAV